MDKETYDSLPLTRWLDKSGKPIEDAQSRMKAQELCLPSETMAPLQASQPASSSRNKIPDPSENYMVAQF